MSENPDPQPSAEPNPTPSPNPEPTPATTEPAATPADSPPTAAEPAEPKSLLGDTPPTSTFGAEAITAETVNGLIPEGFEPNTDSLTEFVDMINGAGNRGDIIKGSLELLAAQQASAEEAIVTEWNAVQDAWRAEVAADLTYGGDNQDASLAKALTVVDLYAGGTEEAEALKEVFKVTGAGNTLSMVRFLNNIANAVPGEGRPVQGSQTPVAKSRADKLFGGTVI